MFTWNKRWIICFSAFQHVWLTEAGSSLATKVHRIQAHGALRRSHVESHCEAVSRVVVHRALPLPLSVSLTVLQTAAELWIQSGDTVRAACGTVSGTRITSKPRCPMPYHTRHEITSTKEGFQKNSKMFSKMHKQVNSGGQRCLKKNIDLINPCCWCPLTVALLKALFRQHHTRTFYTKHESQTQTCTCR